VTAIFTWEGVEYVMSECITCGVRYTVPKNQWNLQQQKGGMHYCSNGHKQGWTPGDNTENDVLRRRAERAEQEQARLAQSAIEERNRRQVTERQLAAQKGVVTKIKRRTAHGVCPCCNRSFEDLRRHMETKHPNFGEAS
jgi:hypothetical protein